MRMPSEPAMRAAIAARDPALDGRFVYGVVTTGVYCRPSCRARAARPENLRFFPGPEAAAAAGFRPCKRCRPREHAHAELVLVARYIEAHADQKLTLSSLAEHAGMSPTGLQRAFKRAFGVSPKAYQDGIRLERLRHALREGDDVTGAIFGAGYGSTSRVYGEAARAIGMPPARYRAGAPGETIHHAARETALGLLMMAATERGVCFAQFGPDATALLAELRREFPNAELVPSSAQDSAAMDDWMTALDASIAGTGPAPDLPLDLRGTAFQIRVWLCLVSVQAGESMSYGELAARVGSPRAARAVASACAANRIAVLVPCHRVLRGDGELGGYRWGSDRKRRLLETERKRALANHSSMDSTRTRVGARRVPSSTVKR